MQSIPEKVDQQVDAKSGVAPGVELEFTSDFAHLKSLNFSFVGTVNLLLLVQDQNVVTEFPVHKDLITGYLPVLSEIIGELPPAPTSKLPYLPLIDDSPSAVRDILACIYRAFLRPANTAAPAISLTQWPTYVNRLRLANKYDMLNVWFAQEETLMPHVTKLVNGCYTKESGSLVLDLAIAADKCRSKIMLASCEAFVVKHFDAYNSHDKEVVNKLPLASVFRISQGVVQHYKNILVNADIALKNTVIEANRYCCPMGSSCMVRNTLNDLSCHTILQPSLQDLQVDDMAQHLASLA